MGKKKQNKTEENIGEVTKSKNMNDDITAIYDQDKENKNENFEKADIDEQDNKIGKIKLSDISAMNVIETEKSEFNYLI